MFTRSRIAAVVAALAAIAALPAVANAASVPMRGVVSGSPYGASQGQMAIPVLFSKMTARNAGLKSPVGVIIMKRTQKVELPGSGTALPVQLRTGDRFKGVGEIGDLQQRVFYPRVVFSKPVIYFRSKELSLAELSAAVDALRTALANLQKQFDALKASSIAAFNALLDQLNALKKQLADLKIPAAVDLTSIQSQIDALNKQLSDLVKSLPDWTKFAKLTDLPDLSGFLTASDLLPYATKAYVDAAVNNLQNQLNALTGTVNGLPTQQDVTDAITGALAPYATTQDVTNAIAPVKAKVNELVGDFNTLCSQVDGSAIGAVVSCPTLTTIP